MIVYQMLNGRRSTKVRTVGGNNEGYSLLQEVIRKKSNNYAE